MSNLKNLLLRIKTIKSTQKTTKVMKMIAASKLKSAQIDTLNSREYEYTMLNNILKTNYNELFEKESTENKVDELLIVITSDRGLCGGYNYSIAKMFSNYIKNKKCKSNYKVLFIGTKGHDILRNQCSDMVIDVINSDKVSFVESKKLLQKYLSDSFNICNVFYTHFESSLSLVPKIERLFPFITYEEYIEARSKLSTVENNKEYATEPDRESVMEIILQEYGYARLYKIIKDSMMSEHMSRMLAMESATTNANKVINSLQLIYNRSRQAKVTSELIEIISGMEAL